MRVVHVVAYLGPDKGGPSVSVPSLARGLLACGVQPELVAGAWPGDDPDALPPEPFPRYAARVRDPSGFGWSRPLGRLLRERARQADLVHSHNLWLYPNWAAASAARRAGRPHVISPRGALEPWARAHSRWKKAIVRPLFQDRALREAACLHALSVSEARNLHALLPDVPVAVVPNGIDAAPFAGLPEREAFGARFPAAAGRKTVLFLARLHPKKGTVHLLQAWSRLHRQHPEWLLVLAGPDEVGHRAEMEAQAAALGITGSILFTGLLAGEAKREALAAADAFVLPSFSEGFSMAVLEAMASGLPVLLTPGCNFPEASAAGAAVEVAATAEGTEEGLAALLRAGDDGRARMGAAARRLVAERYTWEHVARSMRDVYAWCIQGGTRPAPLRWDQPEPPARMENAETRRGVPAGASPGEA